MSEPIEQSVGYNTQRRAYPNFKSYIMSSRGSSRDGDNFYGATARATGNMRLSKARLYSVKASTRANFQPGSYNVQPGSQVITTLFKEFQFNPSAINLDINAAPINPEETEATGGNTEGGATLGLASTSVEMLFAREQETHAANQGSSVFDEYARLGVAKDILDVFAVIKGDQEMLEAGADKKSISLLTSELMDLVRTGSSFLLSSRVAIQFSRDFVLFGFVKSMNFRFVKFNHMLVPTMGYVTLSLDVHDAGNTSLVRNIMAPPPVASSTGSRGYALPSGAFVPTRTNSNPSSVGYGWSVQ